MKPNRVTAALATINLLRSETNPSLTHYAILLALAAHQYENGTTNGLGTNEISERIEDDLLQSGAISRLIAKGLIYRSGLPHKGGTYLLTAAGEQEAARIARGGRKPTPPPTINMAKVIAAVSP